MLYYAIAWYDVINMRMRRLRRVGSSQAMFIVEGLTPGAWFKDKLQVNMYDDINVPYLYNMI